MLYIMSCGCEIENESELKRINNRKTCIIHGGTILSRKGYCVNDGKVFYRKTRGQLGLYCDECQQKAITETNKRKYAKQKIENALKKAAKQKAIEKMLAKNRVIAAIKSVDIPLPDLRDHDNRGVYCKNIMDCKSNNYPACLDCESFYPRFEGVDPGSELWTV